MVGHTASYTSEKSSKVCKSSWISRLVDSVRMGIGKRLRTTRTRQTALMTMESADVPSPSDYSLSISYLAARLALRTARPECLWIFGATGFRGTKCPFALPFALALFGWTGRPFVSTPMLSSTCEGDCSKQVTSKSAMMRRFSPLCSFQVKSLGSYRWPIAPQIGIQARRRRDRWGEMSQNVSDRQK